MRCAATTRRTAVTVRVVAAKEFEGGGGCRVEKVMLVVVSTIGAAVLAGDIRNRGACAV